MIACICCGMGMDGIIDQQIRNTCYECGGDSLDAERLAETKEQALQNAKSYGEISDHYKFREYKE